MIRRDQRIAYSLRQLLASLQNFEFFLFFLSSGEWLQSVSQRHRIGLNYNLNANRCVRATLIASRRKRRAHDAQQMARFLAYSQSLDVEVKQERWKRWCRHSLMVSERLLNENYYPNLKQKMLVQFLLAVNIQHVYVRGWSSLVWCADFKSVGV